jgi:hypothetical protein
MSFIAKNRSEEILAKLSAAQKTGQPVEVTDLVLGSKTEYHAIKAAAKALGIDRKYIENYIHLNQTEPVLGRYTFKLVGEPKVETVRKQGSSQAVEVTDLELNKVTPYPSIGLAAKSLGVRQASISLYLKEGRKTPYLKRYIITKM